MKRKLTCRHVAAVWAVAAAWSALAAAPVYEPKDADVAPDAITCRRTGTSALSDEAFAQRGFWKVQNYEGKLGIEVGGVRDGARGFCLDGSKKTCDTAWNATSGKIPLKGPGRRYRLSFCVDTSVAIRLPNSDGETWRSAIFWQDADTHRVIRGFHFIAVSTDEDCRFWEPQVSFAAGALEAAHEDDPRRAIFFFQHPHLTDTVYGSIVWGERDLNPTLYNYPQVIDFSGHSHVPINDPRSIHQDYVTSVGTGTFSYFEMDEFDKICGTFPPDAGEAAQMQIVEAFDDGSVLIKPWDVLTGQPFHEGWTVERPWDPASFVYTRPIRYRFAENQKPRFPEGAVLTAEQTEAGFRLTFDHAEKVMGSDGREEDVDDYVITVRDGDGILCRRFVIWSPYYLTRRPEKMSYDFPKLKKGVYTVAVKARGFWRNESEDCLEAELIVE